MRGMFQPRLLRHVRKCTCCGKLFLYERPPLRTSEAYLFVKEQGMCFECGYWSGLIAKPPEYMQIASGICYNVMPYVENPTISMILGGKGKRVFFITKDMKAIKSNDVWLIGTIPSLFRDRLKDTGWFCDGKTYKKILNFDKKCNAIGCLDRYKCFRFRTELEIKNGPFNEVPENWEDGGEHCRRFVNTDLICDYQSPIKHKQK